MGPVQVLILGFDDPTYSGEVAAELNRLNAAGIVRLVDLLVLARAADGTLETRDPPPGWDGRTGEVAAALFSGAEDDPAGEPADAADRWSLADVVPPGSVAAIALVEHLWAAPLTAAIRRSGGTPLDETWLAPAELEALEALLAGSAA